MFMFHLQAFRRLRHLTLVAPHMRQVPISADASDLATCLIDALPLVCRYLLALVKRAGRGSAR
jgi:hypothetical protein